MSTSQPASSEGPRPLAPAVRQRLQQLFEHGKKSLDKGDFDYAHDMFAQCVADDPGNLVYLQHLRANLTSKHGEKKKGSMFGGLNMKLKSARSTLTKAASKGVWDEAFKAGCEALKQSPSDIATLLELASSAATLGATECQLYYLKWALDLDGKHEQANRHAADALAKVGQFEQAIACLKRVQQAKPADHDVAKAISQMSVEQTIKKGGYNQEVLRKGANNDALPDQAASEMLGASPASAPVSPATVSPATKPNPSTSEQGAASAQPASAQAGAEDREKQLLDALRIHPEELTNYIELAEIYTTDDRLRDAERVLTKAVAVSGGGDLNLHELLEDTRLRRMRQQTAVADRRAEADKSPETTQLAKRMHAQANQVELEVFSARSQRNPSNVHYKFELGLRMKRAGKYREAVQVLQAARSDVKRLAEIEINLGECFQHIEQYRLAMSSYETAIKAAPDPNSDLHRLARYRAGVLAMGLKEYDQAEKQLTELAATDFGYRDVADRLDKLAQMRDT